MKRWAVAAVLAMLFTTGTAQADGRDAEKEARTFFNVGAKAYEAGKYLDAIRAFEEAYKRVQRPGLLFSLGQAHRRQFFVDSEPARLKDAVRYYREYLAKDARGRRRTDAQRALEKIVPLLPQPDEGESVPTPSRSERLSDKPRVVVSSPTPGVQIFFDGKRVQGSTLVRDVTPGRYKLRLSAPGFRDYQREIVVDKVQGTPPLDIALEELPAQVVLDGPAGAEVSVDGRFVGELPLPPLKLSPGEHFVAVTSSGAHAFTKRLRLKRGEKRTLKPDLETTGQRTASWVLMGVGAGGLVAGGVFGALAVNKENQAQELHDKSKNEGNLSSSEANRYLELRDSRDNFRTLTFVSAGIGLAALTTGFVLYVTDRPRVQVPDLDERAPGARQGISRCNRYGDLLGSSIFSRTAWRGPWRDVLKLACAGRQKLLRSRLEEWPSGRRHRFLKTGVGQPTVSSNLTSSAERQGFLGLPFWPQRTLSSLKTRS